MTPALRHLSALALATALSLGSAQAATPPSGEAESPSREESARNTLIQGCWSDAFKGDGADTKLAFRPNGELIQYDENQQEKMRRTFGAWEMQKDSTFLVVYWPNGAVTRYNVKRIGPILHFTGMFGVRSFTMRQIEPRSCWTPKE